MKLDILAFGAHPDDVELSAAGTLAKLKSEGKITGIIDLTQGELGTRGNAEIRKMESQKAAEILGLDTRENLELADGFFHDSIDNQLKIIDSIRKYQPDVVLINAPQDRHPDHGRAAELLKRCTFLSGLKKIETSHEPWRPKLVFHYIQWIPLNSDFILDISGYLEIKIHACMAYSSQFHDPNSKEPETPITSKNFKESIEYRAKELGRLIGTAAGEGFIRTSPLGMKNFEGLLGL